jgi:hypothetical protein
MANVYPQNRPFRNNATAVERLSDRLRWPTLPWPARRLMGRHGLHAATAATVAELADYAIDGGRQ